ncbi:chromatin assembly factor 1 subunit FAS1 isoform X1 [Benincasa hispida]|uniref:chromatin assembly factor 1 subunit FAS1 isoform X1 n=2 Tax=Benincasa hispida TaxID=102211 RepID=UPI0019029E52|nr:chromatin assembly factor 1 subunit FAS1 isoform X1 [Benincasa hispida]
MSSFLGMDAVVMDSDECSKPSTTDGQTWPRKVQKRKRGCMEIGSLDKEEREAKIDGLQKEIDSLFKYYDEVKCQKVDLDLGQCSSSNSIVAALMEESELPLSKLVDEIYEKMRKIDRGGVVETVTVASVKASVLFVGRRVMYGVPNADADVLEDDSKECLWCWETRDLKLMAKSTRGILNIRRTCRKKIHERVTVLSAMMSTLLKSETDQSCIQEFTKASEKLGKVFDEAKIRVLVDGLSQKIATEMAEKEAKREEKLMVKQLERSQREAEKEKKRIDKEQQKEKLQNEKESKVTEREEKRREKEENEMKKQLRKQQEDAEKDQRRREKEEAEFKKQLSLQKQASLMERFLKKCKPSLSCQNDQSTTELITSVPLSKKSENMPEACTQLMDCTFSSSDVIIPVDIRRQHLSSWRFIGHSVRSRGKKHWGIRQKPKSELFKELKLSAGRESANDDELGEERLVDGWEEQIIGAGTSQTELCSTLLDVRKSNRGKQLLQFAKSYRPAFYGIWSTKSHVVGPRHPFRKDPDLDYDVDSDEEWEEEDPGESLSDCDKDDEENLEEEGCAKAEDDEESEDGFFVPDGYLSENEGVQLDCMETDDADEVGSSPSSKEDMQGKELYSLFKQQKHLYNMTGLALRKNQPLIILNLSHEKDSLLMAEDLDGTSKLEQTCLAALSMRLMQGGCPIEISVDGMADEDPEMCTPTDKDNGTSTQISTSAILDSDMTAIVSTIQSCSQGINKVVESLQHKFPNVPKSHLRNKVREISDFVENRWQVKKEILEKHGVLASPEKGTRRPKTIAAFFSKRCLPPAGKCINPNETSPQSLKPGSAVQDQRTCTNQQ